MSNKLSVIAGGSSGMGKATAAELVLDGRTVLIIGRDEAKLAAAKAELDALGTGTVETLSADLSNAASVDILIARIDSEPRHIDQLVNAAGSFFPKPFLDHEAADYDKYMNVNRATFFVTFDTAACDRLTQSRGKVHLG